MTNSWITIDMHSDPIIISAMMIAKQLQYTYCEKTDKTLNSKILVEGNLRRCDVGKS